MRPRIVRRQSPIHGYGVFANVDLPADASLIEYTGERISHDEAAERYGADRNSGHTFLFTANAHWLIDGNRGGNLARWINHSCAPNCKAEVHVDIDGDERRDKVWISTVRDIRAGEELTFDYAVILPGEVTPEERAQWACRCGAPECSGSMLDTPLGRQLHGGG
ncbi:MAG: SET domain-containing protein-lysine N-methyltransferase [Xanthomonadaceae bacterium]|nr:SET domain-containing protein-lysine N-methyltransferase [Xanthomonadaceae bacterium]